MHQESTPRFDLKTVLAWIGGMALLIWGWQLVTSLQFWYVMLWPFGMLATLAHIQPEDIKPETLLMSLMVLGLVVGILIAIITFGVEGLQKRLRH